MKKIKCRDPTSDIARQKAQEASILASLNSKYVTKYFDSFFDQGHMYLIMEYCENGDFAQFL